jgi:phosphatidylinositol alpha-1,6-mannosyltransferase
VATPLSADLVVASHNFPPLVGGVERMAERLARWTAPGRTLVLAGPHPDAADHDRGAPYEIRRHRLVSRTPPRWWACRRALAATPDVPLLCLEWWPEARAATSLRGRDAAVAVVVHGAEVLRARRSRTARTLTSVLAGADLVVANSDYTAGLLGGVGVIPDAIIHPGVDLDRPAEDPDELRHRLALGDGPVVVSVGRLVAR